MSPEEMAVMLAAHDVKIKNLEQWEDKQNGTLQRLESKVDEKFDALNRWLVGLMGGVIVALLMLLLNLILAHQ